MKIATNLSIGKANLFLFLVYYCPGKFLTTRSFFLSPWQSFAQVSAGHLEALNEQPYCFYPQYNETLYDLLWQNKNRPPFSINRSLSTNGPSIDPLSIFVVLDTLLWLLDCWCALCIGCGVFNWRQFCSFVDSASGRGALTEFGERNADRKQRVQVKSL